MANGDSGKWNINSLYSAMRFITPLLLGVLVYYVSTEDKRTTAELRYEFTKIVDSRLKDYMTRQDFKNWVDWQFNALRNSVDEIKVDTKAMRIALEDHDRRRPEGP